MPDTRKLKPKVEALQRDTAAVLKLLGGDSNDKLRFWEILKGLTTPAELRLLENHIETMTGVVAQMNTSLKAIEKSAKEIGVGMAATA